MTEYIVLSIDGARARFFELAEPENPELESGPTLVERCCLVNPEKEKHGKQMFSDLKSGRNRGGMGPIHMYDDHRERHIDELERRFAKDITGELKKQISQSGCQNLVLVANPRMLGYLRPGLTISKICGVEIKEFSRDICKLSSSQLQKRLEERNLLPARHSPVNRILNRY